MSLMSSDSSLSRPQPNALCWRVIDRSGRVVRVVICPDGAGRPGGAARLPWGGAPRSTPPAA